MKNRLIPLSDYVLELEKEFILNQGFVGYGEISVSNKVIDYTKFLKQNLSYPYYVDGVKCHPLNRFVPCDLEGNILSEPPPFKERIEDFKQYQRVLGCVLFEGFELEKSEYEGCYSMFIESPDLGYDKLYFDTYHFKDGVKEGTINILVFVLLVVLPK